MNKYLLLLVSASIMMFSCAKEDDEKSNDEDPYNATIIEKGIDCGDSFLIRFDSSVSNLPNNDADFVYYEIGLPEANKVNGKRIHVNFRAPFGNEQMVCTMAGPYYPQIVITAVNAFED